MSHTKVTIPIDWVVISSEFHSGLCVEKKLGNVFNDVWSLKLFRKPFGNNQFNVILSIERKRAEKRIVSIIKLKLTDPQNNKSEDVKYVKKFNTVKQLQSNYTLIKKIRNLFTWSESIYVTGDVIFHVLPNSKPNVASPKTLNTLSTDFNKLCNSNIFTDVILKCGSEVFTAHKNILATRCPVFSEMFVNNANEEVKIDIKDVSPQVLKTLLFFIYSGETESMTFESACELLSASDIYRLNELKVLCVNHITSSLSVENVLDYFYKYEAAKSYALEFIAENILEIQRTKQWLNFKQQFPNLVSELEGISEIEDNDHWTDIKQECPGTASFMDSKQWTDFKQEHPGNTSVKYFSNTKQKRPTEEETNRKTCIEQKRPGTSGFRYFKDTKQHTVIKQECPRNPNLKYLT